MSDTVWIAAIVAVPPTLAVLETYRRSSQRANTIEGKVNEVHALANNRLTMALEKIEVLTTAVEKLRGENKALGG